MIKEDKGSKKEAEITREIEETELAATLPHIYKTCMHAILPFFLSCIERAGIFHAALITHVNCCSKLHCRP